MRWLRGLFGAPAAPVAEPPDPEAWLRIGYDCADRGDLAGAERHIRKVLAHDPTHADACYALGRIAMSDRREEEAIDLLQKAVELRPREAAYLEALGVALSGRERYEEAIEIFRTGLTLMPDSAALRSKCAAALIWANRHEEARLDLEKLLENQPDSPEAMCHLGGIYREYGRADESVALFRRASDLMPGDAAVHSNFLLQLNYSASVGAAAMFADHQRFGERFTQRQEPPAPDATWPRRLRVGYVTPDFYNHVVMFFMEPILACHDRERFEVFCYHNHGRKDAVTGRLRGIVENWVDCEELSNVQLAERIRADRIDILVDLAGHNAGNGLQTLAMRPAPVQATYLGYPNTTGLGVVDYRISDAFADPPGESDRFNVERILRLPGSYFCYRPEQDGSLVGPLPAHKSGFVTFGCFNNLAKLSGPFLAMAARVLEAVPNSQLLLKARPLSTESVAQSVREFFDRAGIELSRIQLRGWEATNKDHLSVYGAVDIALDSFPYNGATTTCEAIWMGVPVVSLAGDRHAGRVGSSLLNAVGLGELVTYDADEYVAICVRLAGDLTRLAALRGSLRDRMRRSPLMDEMGFTRGLERCYLEMWADRLDSGSNANTPRAPQ